MKLITERTQILEVSEAWAAQYPDDGWGGDKAVIAGRLRRLNKEKAAAADVAKIIGNSSWTDVHSCDECGAEAKAVVRLWREQDYESRPTYICRACLIKALALTD
mgnify:CR=1 FL=1